MLKVVAFMKQVAEETTDGGKLWYGARISQQSPMPSLLIVGKGIFLLTRSPRSG